MLNSNGITLTQWTLLMLLNSFLEPDDAGSYVRASQVIMDIESQFIPLFNLDKCCWVSESRNRIILLSNQIWANLETSYFVR